MKIIWVNKCSHTHINEKDSRSKSILFHSLNSKGDKMCFKAIKRIYVNIFGGLIFRIKILANDVM